MFSLSWNFQFHSEFSFYCVLNFFCTLFSVGRPSFTPFAELPYPLNIYGGVPLAGKVARVGSDKFTITAEFVCEGIRNRYGYPSAFENKYETVFCLTKSFSGVSQNKSSQIKTFRKALQQELLLKGSVK